jgi:hypothetical protein
MKKLFLSFLLLSIFACNSNDKKTSKTDIDTTGSTVTKEKIINRSVVGKWKPIEAALTNRSEKEKQELLTDMIIEFTSDGKFISTMKEDINTGTYMHSEQDNKLTTIASQGKQVIFSIEWVGDHLRLSDADGSVTMKRL